MIIFSFKNTSTQHQMLLHCGHLARCYEKNIIMLVGYGDYFNRTDPVAQVLMKRDHTVKYERVRQILIVTVT